MEGIYEEACYSRKVSFKGVKLERWLREDYSFREMQFLG